MNKSSQLEELLLVEEVAREMRTTVWAIRYWIRTGKLPAIRPGRRLLIRRSDMKAFLASSPARLSPRAERPAPLRLVPSELDRRRAEQILRDFPSKPAA